MDFPPLVCDLCGSIFFGNKDLREHINYVHNEAKVKHPCDDCGKEFRQKGDLTRHVRTVHWKIRNIPMEAKCDDCGKEFAFKSEAKRHMRMVHLKDMKTGEPIERKMCSGKCCLVMSHSIFWLMRIARTAAIPLKLKLYIVYFNT